MKDHRASVKKFIEQCTTCGLCAIVCPPFAHRSVPDTSQDIQRQIRSYLEGGPVSEAVVERARLCNECWKCVSDTCPQGLDPLRTNHVLRGSLHEQGHDIRPFIPPSDPHSFEITAASLLTTEEECRRITTPAVSGDGRILFFPGCNIYYQPNLLLTAMDILDSITDGWTFLPGLQTCCGSNHDSAGRLPEGKVALEGLAAALAETGLEQLVLWCSACAVRLRYQGFDLPVRSFARLVAERLGSDRAGANTGGVTIQEPCTNAHMDMDPGAPREVIRLVTGEPVKEMTRHGRDTVCCGWSLYQHQPEAWNEEFAGRMLEARAAGAETLATVCHGCQWVMDKPHAAEGAGVRVVNYIRLAGEALGISHPERFSVLRKSGTVEDALTSIQREMGSRFDQLPFEEGRIRETAGILMGGFYGT